MSTWDDQPDRDTPPFVYGGSGFPPGGDVTAYGPPPPPPPSRAPRRGRRIVGAIAAFAVLVAALGIGGVVASSLGSSGTKSLPARPVSQAQLNAAAIATQIDPAVVDITATLALEGATAAGTGMVVTPSGEVLTNNHVVEGSTGITVKIAGRSQTFTAKVVGTDPNDDVALLQVQGVSGLPTVRLGDSARVTVGQPVVAIGNALNLPGPPKVTQGTITNLGRSITVRDSLGHAEQLSNLIETNAALQPGNSGGPLIDSAGKVIGMNTAAASAADAASAGSNDGFAIPINAAESVVQQIQAGHESTNVHLGPTAFLGVRLQPDDSVPVPGGGRTPRNGGTTPSGAGAVIVGVNDGSPAQAAGLAAGDTIVSLGGTAVSSSAQLTQLVHARHPGDNVTVEWTDRSGQRHTANVRLTSGPAA